jgi:hypothetical protein
MSLRKLLRTAAFFPLACGFVYAKSPAAQQKKVDCGKPPQLMPPSKESKQQKQSKTKAHGSVAIEISEDGDVVDAKAVHPSSAEEADRLVSAAKSMKFKPRPGCGAFKTVVNFGVGD